ncbi:hypothetical protein [Streptomyces sp. NPDC046887]|uniref:hypothetical protein n=1 Tax=Streptomyces sp. NPDC046887 TaxID=3155472 RepID=UPI0033F4BA64
MSATVRAEKLMRRTSHGWRRSGSYASAPTVHLRENIAGAGLILSDEGMAELDGIGH